MKKFSAGYILLLGILRFVLCSNVFEPLNIQDLYLHLGLSAAYVVLYLYAPGCEWCRKLNPRYEVLSKSFANGNLTFVKVNGRQFSRLCMEFGVKSFPELLLLEPKEPPQIQRGKGDSKAAGLSQRYDLVSVYYGERELDKLALWLTGMTCVIPDWEDSSVIRGEDNPEEIARRLPEYWSVELQSVISNIGHKVDQQVAARPVVLAFVTPWMNTEFDERFGPDPTVSLIEKMANEIPQVEFHSIDASIESLAPIVNAFRCSMFPTLVLLTTTQTAIRFTYIQKNALWDMDGKLTTEIIKNCGTAGLESRACKNSLSHAHHLGVYASLQELHINTEEPVLDELDKLDKLEDPDELYIYDLLGDL
ncbi:protein disulfide isomerase family protein Ecym_7169 [Eremothecium cymbalariae DBVPG|uniref:Thioredoxin domain-containing protein n=1 Tax=Eremothecium cymbalariae (strain CBS 270.75 / DBVPG 7215 / KCTC 17166 / NRRL Y-17582) TaxID=931890 RepID=G8JW02_ERECY|nr:hypothetical protein Ecym_7169 [Eremothecium cymbalariae DBVPG\